MAQQRSAHHSRALLIPALAAVLALSACGSSSSTASSPSSSTSSATSADNNAGNSSAPGGKTVKIGVMIYSTDGVPFYAPYMAGLTAEAKATGVDMDIQNGQNDPARQSQLVQQFVTEKKDVILVSAGDANAIVPAIRQANAAGIPVIAITNDIGKGASRLTYAGTDNVQYGNLLGEGALKVGGPNAKIAVILGGLGSDAQLNRTKGLTQFVSAHPGLKIIDQQSADWNNAKALKVGQDFLSKYPNGTLDVIVTEGPEGATAAKYAASNGRTDVKFVIGDVSKDVAEQLKAGSIAGAVFQNPYDQGQQAIKYAIDAATGNASKIPQPDAYAPMNFYTAAEAAKIPANALF